MSNDVVHFAIHADDVERARRFYEDAFGWRFEAWGPPGFYRIDTGGDGAIEGALHGRDDALTGSGVRSFECTVAVEDLDAIATSVRGAGGTVVGDPVDIPTVGTLLQLRDTEGNHLQAMHYLVDPR